MADSLPLQPTSSVPAHDLTGTRVGRFAIRARLGAGGMGEVYLADDTKLKRPVALKRVAPRLRSDPSYRRRLLSEAQRASFLSDQNIAHIYDVFEENDETFLVMEYVKGVTLRHNIHKPADIKDFLSLAVQCAQALVAPHEAGIVHCDIKPENIMLTPAGQVKILDFGVAKGVPKRDDPNATETDETQSGPLVGTPAYMAPELLLGKEPDGRADIFSLGVVFYEALTGRHPFRAPTSAATNERILHEDPPPLDRPVPTDLKRILAKMLAKDPAERYATSADLLVDLRALEHPAPDGPSRSSRISAPAQRTIAVALGLVAIILLLLSAPGVRDRLELWLGIPEVPEEKALVVLPFSALGSNAENKAFSDGLTETLTAQLTKLTEGRALQVFPASEVRTKKVTTVEQARAEFGVNLVLEGSLHQAGEMVRVTTVLIDARTHRQLRSDTVTAAMANPLAVEDQVVSNVIAFLKIELQPQEQKALSAHGTTQPVAFDYYLQGRGYLQDNLKPENIDNALTAFNRALEKDPHYALAFAGLGEAYGYKYYYTKDSAWVAKSRSACEQAILLQGQQAEGHICLGAAFGRIGEYENGIVQFRRAIELEPTNDFAYTGLAEAQEGLGNVREAEKTYLRAISLRPNYSAGYNSLGAFYFNHGRYPEAARMFDRMVAIAPDSFVGYQNLGGVYVSQGRYPEAIPVLERSVSIRPTAGAASNLGTAYFGLRRYSEAARFYEEAVKLSDQEFETWGNLGDAYYWAGGMRDKAADAYRKAISLANRDLTVNARDAKTLSYVAYYQAMLGEKSAALSILQRAVQVDPRNVELLFNAALIYNQAGDTARALKCLEKALAAGLPPAQVRNTPNFDSLREDPGFQALMKEY